MADTPTTPMIGFRTAIDFAAIDELAAPYTNSPIVEDLKATLGTNANAVLFKFYRECLKELNEILAGRIVPPGIGSGGGLVYTTGAAKTGAYTAMAGELVRTDASGGTFAVTLPASQDGNAAIGVIDTSGTTTQITVDTADAATVVDPVTRQAVSVATCPGQRAAWIWQYDGPDAVWRLLP